MIAYKTTPVSKKKLKDLAIKFRNDFGVQGLLFPVLDIIDDLHCQGLINLLIVDDDCELLSSDEIALYELNSNTMYIKYSVFQEASNDVGRSRFTLAHELSHYLLLYVLNFEVIETNDEIKAYEDPEWQADNLAGELLAPYELTKDFTASEYMNKCLLSEECAIVLWDKRRK